MGELLVWVVIPMIALFAGRAIGKRGGYAIGFDAGRMVGQRQGIDLAKLHQAGKDSARARKGVITKKQRAAIRELGNSEV